jgi:predicted O-linked N-acetylglucosamine transferase (SPINDLY family)
MSLSERLKLYQQLFFEKKFSQIINEIENFEKNKNSQILNILGVCKIMNKKKNKKDLLSAKENFREAYLKEKHSSAGLEALANFMNVSVDLGEFEESIKYYKEEEKNFDYNEKLLKALSRIYQFSIRNNERKKILERIIKNKSKSLEVWCSYIYINNFENIIDQKKHYEIAKEFSKQIEDYGLKKIKLDKNIKKRKIALGFLTADYHGKYSITYYLKGLIKNINKNKFHLIAISNRKINDESREELKLLFDELIEINSLDDLNAINFIRQKKLDIIFDIMGVTSKTRIVLFKNKISPIQINWLGYCNTTGLDEMDYIFCDPNLIFGEEEKYYSEKVKRLPEIWNAHPGFNQKRKKIKLPLLKNNYFTFASLNNFNKISDITLKCWSEILKKTQNSKLILKSSISYNLDNFIERLKKFEIFDQVHILKTTGDFFLHLKQYDEIDLALDTFPYNGVTTTFEALWKGIPVLTIEGYNFNSRCGVSIIKNSGIDFLIAKDQNDYVSKAIFLAKNKDKLIEIRNDIFENVLKTPLFNISKFTKNFEKLIEECVSEKLLMKNN